MGLLLFETDLATRQMKGVAIAAGKEETFPLVDSDKPTGVYVTSSGKATASLENQNGTNFTLVSEKYGTKVDCTDGLSQTELIYPFKVLSYKLSLRTVEMPVYFKNPRNTFAGLWWGNGEKQVSLSVRKKEARCCWPRWCGRTASRTTTARPSRWAGH